MTENMEKEVFHQQEEERAATANLELDEAKVEQETLFSYIKRPEFTSEIFKIEITNLPLNFGYGQLKKLLNDKLQLKSHKIKGVSGKATWAFVTFRCDEDRKKALSVLEGYKWKGKILKVKTALPAADPIAKKRQAQRQENTDSKRAKDDIPIAERLKSVVAPLSDIPYDEQLVAKEEDIRQFLEQFEKSFRKTIKTCPKWLQDNREKYRLCSQLNPIAASPVTDCYRNKCEFTIGMGPSNKPTIGFRLTRYAAGSMIVADINDCNIVSSKMKAIVQVFQDYIRKSDRAPFNPETHSGYWRQLTVRSNHRGELLVIVVFHPQNLSQEDLADVKKDLKQFFGVGQGSGYGVSSAYFQAFALRESGKAAVLDHIFGEKFIFESLMGLNFRISPDAFFQINSVAAEVLYKQISSFVVGSEATAIVDICCGTGTIGIILAKLVKKVLGIEMVTNAVEDAEFNASLNGINNISFVCGKAEDVLYHSLNMLSGEKVVAVVDPPRAGLHNKVIRNLRSCHAIQKLVYISCDPKAALINFVDLARPVSNQYRGEPFILQSATPVDMFPHTKHCELVLFFERQTEKVDCIGGVSNDKLLFGTVS